MTSETKDRHMADEPEDQHEELEPNEIDEQPETEQPEGDEPQPESEEDDELTLTLDDIAPDNDEDQPGDNNVVRTMRQRLREKERELAELRAKAQPAAVELGPKPKLEDFDYDEEQHEAALLAWHKNKEAEDAKAEAETSRRAAQQKTFEDAGRKYREEAATLNVPDFEERQAAVEEALGPISELIALSAKKPAKVVAALGRNPTALAELAKLKDNPWAFVAAVARAEARGESTMKKRTAPAIDRPSSGSAAMPGAIDKQLEKLESEAARTGDRTKVIAYKASKRAAGK